VKFPSAPRQPFLGLVLAAIIGIIVADFSPLPPAALVAGTVTLAFCALVFLFWPNLWLTYLLVGAGFFLLHTLQTTNTPGERLAARLGDRARAVKVAGAVSTEPEIAENGVATFLLRLQSIDLEGKNEASNASLLVRWRGHPEFGDELTLFGIAEPLGRPRNPGEFDMRTYLARHDVYRRLFVRYAEDGVLIRHAGGNPILRAAQSCRTRIQTILCRDLEGAPEAQDLISGITLGLRHQTPEDIEEPFQQTGTLHLFAVAGLHVGIVAWLLLMLAKVGRLSRKWAATLIIPLLLFYAAITGLHVSSVRAAIMGAFLLGGLFFERKVLPLNSLAAAAFLLLGWNTNEIFSTGFQLSFAVVGTIILLANPLARLFRRWSAPDPFLPRNLLRGSRWLTDRGLVWLGKGTSVSLAAWIGSLVLILWYFYLVTPISLLANLVVVPIAFFILATALLSLISAPLSPWLSVIFNNANWCLGQIILVLVHLFAQIPTGHYYLEHPCWPDGAQVRINVLDLGPGAATHVRAGRDDWLFDCGSERDYQQVVRDYLHAAGVNKLHGVLLTHGDSFHIGGAGRLVAELRPGFLMDNPAPDKSSVHRRLRALFGQHAIPTKHLVAGDTFQLDRGVNAKVLFPVRGFSATAADNQSLVIQVLVPPATRILFMSDSGIETEDALLASAMDLRSDILVKGQNRTADSGSEKFLRSVQPQLIIATSRDFPDAERIKDEWAEWVKSHGIKLFRQDETGAVQLRFRPHDWEGRAYVTGEVFRSSSR
jgi:competence protein ComEC